MSDPSRMPAIFFGHGNPMNALHDNVYGRGWAALAARVPRPRAILCVSAHWYVPYTAVTAIDKPRTIHDFGGFPRALFEVQYPAPGSPELAQRVAQRLAPVPVAGSRLGPGSWNVVRARPRLPPGRHTRRSIEHR